MRVTAELFPARRAQGVDLGEDARGIDLLRALGLTAEAHILVRMDVPIPADEPLVDGDRIRVIGVVSGGAYS